MEQNVYYVYLHRKGSNNEVFYIGKGKGKRAKTRHNRSRWWNNIVDKHGFVVEIVESGMSEEDAFDLEIETIKFYRDNNHIICNMTEGGEGYSGKKHSEEVRAKIKAYRNTEAFKRNVTLTRGRKVLCSNGMVFDSGRIASAWMSEQGCKSAVSFCCNRQTKQSGGFVWRWLDDSDDLQDALDQGLDPYIVLGGEEAAKHHTAKKVRCCNGMEFDSAFLAAKWLKTLGFSRATNTQVLRCCNGKTKKTYGYIFQYV